MKRNIVATAAAGILLLTGCTADTNAESTPTPEPVVAVTPEATPMVSVWTAPDECLALDLTTGALLDGAGLGACVATALSSYGSGRQYVQSNAILGEVSFRYAPEFEMQGDMHTHDGPIRMTYLDGTMWIDSGEGPVKGDVTSSDPEEALVGTSGELYRLFSDPAMAADLVAAGGSWLVGAVEDLQLGNGAIVPAYPITAAAPFTWNDIPVEESLVWFAPDWTPLGVRGTVTVMGFTETTKQTFYDLGQPVDIAPVG